MADLLDDHFYTNTADNTHCMPACVQIVYGRLTGKRLTLSQAEEMAGYEPGKLTWQFGLLRAFSVDMPYYAIDFERFSADGFVKDPARVIEDQIGDPDAVRYQIENSDLDAYESLQEFVEQNVEGKAFEADIKAAGFGSVNDWNLALTTLGFAYAGVVDDQSAEISQQIAELEADTELAQDMKDRMITSLKAMIPSENNKKVVEDLLANADYAEKLKQIELVEE